MSLHELLGINAPVVIEDEVPEKKKALTPFDYIDAISHTKEDLFDGNENAEKEYNAYIVNRGLSFGADTVLYANEMNRYHFLQKQHQFQFLQGTIRKRKRYNSWIRAEKESEDIAALKEYYNYSNDDAKYALSLLMPDQLELIKQRLNKGGLAQKGKKRGRD